MSNSKEKNQNKTADKSSSHLVHPHDEKLFHAFQHNLLSLISHELRTPLTGVLNSVGLLKEKEISVELQDELVDMAYRNAKRLHHMLSSLLDVAAVSSGALHIRLREVDLGRLLKRSVDDQLIWLKGQGIELSGVSELLNLMDASPVLADAHKIHRVFDICLHILSEWAAGEKKARVSPEVRGVRFCFEFSPSCLKEWESAWNQALSGSTREGIASALFAFTMTIQSEDEFLSRTREGLGSEFLLIHEVMKLHKGEFQYEFVPTKSEMNFWIRFPELKPETLLHEVISSRVYESTHGLRSAAVAFLMQPEKSDPEQFFRKIKSSLFRSTDAAYWLPQENAVVIVMDDCKVEDAPRIMERIIQNIDEPVQYGVACCPEETTDPEVLVKLAKDRISKKA